VPTQTVWLELHGADTNVHVREYGRLAGNLQIDSCNVCGNLAEPHWERSTRDAVNSRLASEGLNKGRVLYARRIQYPSPDLIPVGAVTLHVDNGLLRVLHLGYVKGLLSSQRDVAAALLISCCCVIAKEHGCTQLEMLLHTEANVRQYCGTKHGFRRVPRRGHRYDGLRRNDYLVEKLLRI
jgi:hypothetical protein